MTHSWEEMEIFFKGKLDGLELVGGGAQGELVETLEKKVLFLGRLSPWVQNIGEAILGSDHKFLLQWDKSCLWRSQMEV